MRPIGALATLCSAPKQKQRPALFCLQITFPGERFRLVSISLARARVVVLPSTACGPLGVVCFGDAVFVRI